MPRPGLPPTPASSTDISGKDHTYPSSLETSFSLPPPAIAGTETARSSSASTTKSSSESSFPPISPTSPLSADTKHSRSRLRPSVTQRPSNTADDFSLPPPPTRSRKIIQMKPKRPQHDQLELNDSPRKSKNPTKAKAVNSTGPSSLEKIGKKKQPSSTSVAGRKIARKTAHSLIERRRRSKMNEEFGVLKDMIPACKDQEMHKLAILQASIDYLRYLEHCVCNLKAATNSTYHSFTTTDPSGPTPTSPHVISAPASASASQTETDNDNDHDLEMPDSERPSPLPAKCRDEPKTWNHHHPQYSGPTTSPAATNTTSPALTPHTDPSHPNSYNYTFHSALPSPAFMPQNHQQPYISHSTSASASTSTSPNLGPQLHPQSSETMNVDIDHETTAACLLMLNTDRRGTSVGIIGQIGENGRVGVGLGGHGGRGRGMSVRDLLSS